MIIHKTPKKILPKRTTIFFRILYDFRTIEEFRDLEKHFDQLRSKLWNHFKINSVFTFEKIDNDEKYCGIEIVRIIDGGIRYSDRTLSLILHDINDKNLMLMKRYVGRNDKLIDPDKFVKIEIKKPNLLTKIKNIWKELSN